MWKKSELTDGVQYFGAEGSRLRPLEEQESDRSGECGWETEDILKRQDGWKKY
jgi:hypothetical protein